MKIAILGKMRSGKDTASDYLHTKVDFKTFAFGDGITGVITRYFPKLLLEGKPRHAYQLIGQTFRSLRPAVWIDELDTRVWHATFGIPDPDILVTDLRQMNEYDYLKEEGYTIIKIEADEELRLARIAKSGDSFDPSTLNHETETAVDVIPYDYLVTNNGTLEELFEQLDFVLEELAQEGNRLG